MNKDFYHRIINAVEERRSNDLLRSLRIRTNSNNLLDLANNDYLRLSQNQTVKEASMNAIEEYGCSSSASPLVTGYGEIHDKLSTLLCKWYNAKHCLLWNTGYSANQAVLGLLPKKGDLILADRLIHNSMITGAMKSGAKLKRYDHLDIAHLEKLLKENRSQYSSVFVVTESLFSMDGDIPDLTAMAKLKKQHSFIWIVDEAHAIGWYGDSGSGLLEENDITHSADIIVGTMGKGIGSMGAYTILNNISIKEYLINFAGEFIYSTYLTPGSIGASLKAIEIIQDSKVERFEGRKVSLSTRMCLNKINNNYPTYDDSPIIPFIIGSSEETISTAQRLKEKGYSVGAIRPPTVPIGTARLRISLNTKLSKDIGDKLTKALAVS